ncbi:uncharacterized protein LOC103854945 isoform X3 [Brassica rapa]|nr:uncharacterized protein LOC103854945 isoform X3 [Brassica rapa]
MFLWVVENPPPANIMLISGDIDFSDALHRLRMRRYNILLAHPQNISPSLVASAKTSWLWRSLLLASGSSLTQCGSSGVLDGSEITSEDVSEHVLSTQAMDSGSGSSKAARSKLKGIYVPKAPNELLVKEANRKKLQKKCSETKNVEESVQNNDQESLKCLEKQNKELMETITTSERNVAPLNVDYVYGELSRDFPVPKEVRESFDAIPMKLEPTQNEIVIEELEGMLKQILQIKSGEPETAPAGLSENLKEDMNKKKKKRNKKKSRVIEEDKAEPYVCSICSVICDSPAIFESHLNGRKHAAMVEKHAEALLGDKQIPYDVVQHNGHLIDGEASENIDYFEDVPEIDYKPLPNEEAREWIDAIFNTQELSQNANLTLEFESMLNQSLEMNSGDYEGVTEHPEEFKDKVSKDKAESEAYVCSICSVVCACPTVFESHLMGRRHAAKVKKHAEVLFDDKKILEESLKEKDHPRDSMVKILEVSLEDTSKQTVVEAGSTSERVEEEKHAATVKKREPVVKKHDAVVKKQAGTKFAYVRKNGP